MHASAKALSLADKKSMFAFCLTSTLIGPQFCFKIESSRGVNASSLYHVKELISAPERIKISVHTALSVNAALCKGWMP